jgi:hypothetical protein
MIARLRHHAERSFSGSPPLVIGGFAVIIGYLAALVLAMDRVKFSTWSVLIYVPTLAVISVPIILKVAAGDDQPVAGIAVGGLFCKLAASFVRFYVAFGVYGGVADAATYDVTGREIATSFWNGQTDALHLIPHGRSTEFLKQLTGLLYSMIGPSRLAGFLFYAWIGYWGLFLFQRAMVIGFPEADQRRFAWFVFFLPSLLFWPSSIGKEAFMTLCIGLASYGAARILERRSGGIALAVIGCVLGGIVRPHVSVMVVGALTLAIMFRKSHRRPLFGPFGRIALIFVFIVASAFAFSQAIHYLSPQGDTSLTTATEVLTAATNQTAGGGSYTEGASPNSPSKYPAAMFSVLFRPTILEANNKQNLAAAIETTFMLLMLVLSVKRLRRIPQFLFRRPYLLYSLGYTLLFTFAWSSFSNLGALARQRVQVWPLLIIVFAIPLPEEELPPSGFREPPGATSRRDMNSVSSERIP